MSDEGALIYVFDGGVESSASPMLVHVFNLSREEADVVMNAWCQDMNDNGVLLHFVGVARELRWDIHPHTLYDYLYVDGCPKTASAYREVLSRRSEVQ